jgi:hypothetical protein
MADSSGPLFSSDLISPEVLKELPEGYSCRAIERADYHNSFLDVLRVLTTVGDITEEVSHPAPLPSNPFPHNLPLTPHAAMERALHLDVRAQ